MLGNTVCNLLLVKKKTHVFNYNMFTILGNLRQCLDLDDHVQI